MTATGHMDRFVWSKLPQASGLPEFIFETPELHALQLTPWLNATRSLLDTAVEQGHGDRPALIDKHHQCSYGELQSMVNRVAGLLSQHLHLIPGNRVLLRGVNSIWLAVCWLAVWKAGGVAVGTMPLLRTKELKEIIQLAQISHALCEASLAEELQDAVQDCPELRHLQLFAHDSCEWQELLRLQPSNFTAVDTAAADPALIAFTSGTTGVPKGCVHSHQTVLAMCEVFPRHCLKPQAHDIFIGTPPLAFTFGLGGLLCFPLWARACSVLLDKPSPEQMLAAIDAHQASICISSPTAYRQMTSVAYKYALTSLKKCVSAGEALPIDTRRQWLEATGIDIHNGVGSTEMMHIYIASSPEQYRSGPVEALGQVLPGYRAKLVNDHMQGVPTGTEGRLAIKGPTGCRYLDDVRQAQYVRDGWNLTGDTYHCDAQGYFHFHARSDDIIVTSGYNVSSPEVESALLQHPAVCECGVIGAPDPERGQIIKAFVVLKPPHQALPALVTELQNFVKHSIAPYKYPRAISFVNALPRTETGKLQRFKLKAMT
jgi:2-aminobenzoate-CoA ligase